MSLKKVKYLLAIAQIGTIWAKRYKEVKILKTITAIGFLALFINSDSNDQDDVNTFNKQL